MTGKKGSVWKTGRPAKRVKVNSALHAPTYQQLCAYCEEHEYNKSEGIAIIVKKFFESEVIG